MEIVKSSLEINYIFKKGIKFPGKHFTIIYLKDEDNLKFAALAGKKIFKRAVDRNFVKRRLKALFRNSVNKIRTGKFLIIGQRGAMLEAFSYLEDDMKEVLRHI